MTVVSWTACRGYRVATQRATGFHAPWRRDHKMIYIIFCRPKDWADVIHQGLPSRIFKGAVFNDALFNDALHQEIT